ncbi:hypothetical protein HDV63DRAFT_136861 [Trichoderma sp. SZMC 28014]
MYTRQLICYSTSKQSSKLAALRPCHWSSAASAFSYARPIRLWLLHGPEEAARHWMSLEAGLMQAFEINADTCWVPLIIVESSLVCCTLLFTACMSLESSLGPRVALGRNTGNVVTAPSHSFLSSYISHLLTTLFFLFSSLLLPTIQLLHNGPSQRRQPLRLGQPRAPNGPGRRLQLSSPRSGPAQEPLAGQAVQLPG